MDNKRGSLSARPHFLSDLPDPHPSLDLRKVWFLTLLIMEAVRRGSDNKSEIGRAAQLPSFIPGKRSSVKDVRKI